MLFKGILLLCFCAADGSQEAKLSADRLLDAHQRTRRLVHTADVHMDTVAHLHIPGYVMNRRVRWAFREGRQTERVCVSLALDRPADLASQDNFEDYFTENGRAYSLTNCDPTRPPAITVRNQQGVRASISPKSRVLPVSVDPSVLLLFAFTAYETEPTRTLEELLREASSVKVIGRENVEGRDLWHLHVSYTREKSNADFPFEYDVFLDPSVGFLVRLVRTTQPTGEKTPATIVRTYRITKFRDYGNGVFFPCEGEYTAGGGGDKDVVTVISRVTKAAVNQNIPKDAFDFRFPQYTLVSRNPPVNGRVKVAVWGADNKPMAEFSSHEEYESLAQILDPVPSGNRP